MKKYLLLFSILIFACFSAESQTHLRERVYLSTDKDVYVAGDMMWLSAYCIDLNTQRLSEFSSIAYIEIHSADGLEQSGRIALNNGRGGGRIVLNNSLPTGNYMILAYTAQSFNEDGFDYLSDPHIVSIFNTFSAERVAGGVEITDEDSDSPVSDKLAAGQLSINVGQRDGKYVPITLTNSGNESASINLSIYHDDGIASPSNDGIASFVNNFRHAPSLISFTERRIAEYEGEIIQAELKYDGAEDLDKLAGRFSFISAPGMGQNVYSSIIDKSGTVSFFTGNIFGDNDLFLEIEDIDKGNTAYLELKNPFANVDVKQVPVLKLKPEYAQALNQRSLSMQIEHLFNADSLYESLPVYGHELFGKEKIRYVLDDYTRFPLMEEVFVEFIPELRARKVNGKRDLQVRMEDSYKTLYYSPSSSLALIDGVPVLDQEKIFTYDPLLVQYIDIYPNTYYLGVRGFTGVVNFVTYKRNMPSVTLPESVRVVDYQGPAYPVAYTCHSAGDDYPDYRQTIFWHPDIKLKAGESITIKCKTPAYSGRFNLRAEGLTEDCDSIVARSSFEIK